MYDVLKEKSGKITIGAGHDDWVKFNPGQTGMIKTRSLCNSQTIAMFDRLLSRSLPQLDAAEASSRD